jgi:hypothetical protein
MRKFHYIGPEVQLGRFGTVTRGDVLELTGKEAEGIQGDKRFKPFDPKAKFTPSKLALPDGFDDLVEAEQKKILAKLEQAEKDRLADLEKANLTTAKVELDEMSRAELLDYATGLRERGTEVKFKTDASRKVIKAAIELALGINPHDETGEAEETQTEAAGADGGAGDTGKPDATGEAGPVLDLPAAETLEAMTIAELDEVIATLAAAGKVVEVAPHSKRAEKLAAVKIACGYTS